MSRKKYKVYIQGVNRSPEKMHIIEAKDIQQAEEKGIEAFKVYHPEKYDDYEVTVIRIRGE